MFFPAALAPTLGPIAGKVLGSVATSLLGGILGSGKSKSSSNLDLIKLRDDAQAAGFNPLTVLNATGGQGFTSQASSTDINFGAAAAAAIGAGVADYWTGKQERDLVDAQIDLTKAQTASIQAGPFGASVRSVQDDPGDGWKIDNPYEVVAKTAQGQPIFAYELAAESRRVRLEDEGLKTAYGDFNIRPTIPTADHMSALAGDVAESIWGGLTLTDIAKQKALRAAEERAKGRTLKYPQRPSSQNPRGATKY